MPENERSPSERDPPQLRAGSYVHKDDLAALAAEAVKRSGKTQEEVADELGQKPPAVSRAVSQPSASAVGLRKEIVEHLTDYELEGPFYRLVKR